MPESKNPYSAISISRKCDIISEGDEVFFLFVRTCMICCKEWGDMNQLPEFEMPNIYLYSFFFLVFFLIFELCEQKSGRTLEELKEQRGLGGGISLEINSRGAKITEDSGEAVPWRSVSVDFILSLSLSPVADTQNKIRNISLNLIRW